MLYEGLLERLSQAKGAILRNDFSYKADRIAKAQGIIYGLENSLNRSADPALYDRMLALYEYMRDRLTTASLSLETGPIDECINLLLPIKQAWDKIPNDVSKQIIVIIRRV
jgi:flagellar protein FliS